MGWPLCRGMGSVGRSGKSTAVLTGRTGVALGSRLVATGVLVFLGLRGGGRRARWPSTTKISRRVLLPARSRSTRCRLSPSRLISSPGVHWPPLEVIRWASPLRMASLRSRLGRSSFQRSRPSRVTILRSLSRSTPLASSTLSTAATLAVVVLGRENPPLRTYQAAARMRAIATRPTP